MGLCFQPLSHGLPRLCLPDNLKFFDNTESTETFMYN
jgi:hypothetical protein